MTFRTYDYSDFDDINTWIEIKLNTQRGVKTLVRTEMVEWVDTFATGVFLITLNTIVFNNEVDAVMFNLGNKYD